MSDGSIFLLSWDMLGIEAVVNITEIDQEATWAMLQDLKPRHRLSSVVNAVMLRARYNSQRHYEVYTVAMSKDITEQDVREMFDANPQGMADLIRERGHKMYSARLEPGEIKIL
jgi:hypothetical protein